MRDGLRIGRAGDNNIILNHKYVSKRHAQIVQAEDGLHIKDTNSKNGVRINGEDIIDALLKEGDKITIGKAEVLRVEA